MTTEAAFFVAGLIVGGLIVGTIVGIGVYRVALIGAEEWVQDHVDEDHLLDDALPAATQTAETGDSEHDCACVG